MLTGFGTITGNVSNPGGTVEPGLSPGALMVVGNFTQAAGGTLLIELGGPGVGQFDTLSVSGNATLNGTLGVSLLGNFKPAASDVFTFLTCAARSGSFSNAVPTGGVGKLSVGAGTFDVTYAATSVTLSNFSPVACFGDLTGDKQINQSDLGVLLGAWGTCPGNPGYVAAAGTLGGGPCVGQEDLGALLSVYGTSCP